MVVGHPQPSCRDVGCYPSTVRQGEAVARVIWDGHRSPWANSQSNAPGSMVRVEVAICAANICGSASSSHTVAPSPKSATAHETRAAPSPRIRTGALRRQRRATAPEKAALKHARWFQNVTFVFFCMPSPVGVTGIELPETSDRHLPRLAPRRDEPPLTTSPHNSVEPAHGPLRAKVKATKNRNRRPQARNASTTERRRHAPWTRGRAAHPFLKTRPTYVGSTA